MKELSATAIDRIVERVFVAGESSLEAEAQPFEAAELQSMVIRLRKSMIATVAALPDAAFDVRAEAPASEDDWSAGQIVSHNADRMIWVVRQILSLTCSAQVEIPDSLTRFARREPKPLTRSESLAVLGQANGLLDNLFTCLVESDPGTTTVTSHFGVMSAKGWLLLLTIHDRDHANQLAARQNWAAGFDLRTG